MDIAASIHTADDIAPLAELWRWFVTDGFGTYSPLYAAIGRGVAEDPELIELTLDAGTAAARFPLVLMAATHELALDGRAPELAEVYDAWSEGDRSTDPFPAFRQACLTHRDALVARMAGETTQTNEVGRSALIGLGLAHVVEALGGGDWALVEAGASAGLNLRYDRYRLDFGAAGAVGDPASPVRIECRPDGALPVPEVLPVPVERVGLDQDPVDLTDADARRWLLACTWPDTGRMERTRAAHAVVAADPPPIVAGDMVDDLPAVLAGTAPEVPVVVLTTWAFGYLAPEQRDAFTALLAEESRRRPVAWLSGEQQGTVALLPEVDVTASEPGTEAGVLGLVRFAGGEQVGAEVLAVCHPHGRWIRWHA